MSVEIGARRLLVDGRVQGVGYRQWTARQAAELGLSGWVRNLEDGRVEIQAEGSADALSTLELRCARGPRQAVVRAVLASPVEATGASGFQVQPTGRL